MLPLEFMQQINELLSKGIDEDQTYVVVFKILEKLLPFDAATLYIIDPQDQHLRPVYQYGPVEVDLAGDFAIGKGKGLSGWIAQSREPVIIASLSKSRPGREGRFYSLLALPLIAEERLIGVLNLASFEDNCYSYAERDHYRALAVELSLIIDRLRLQVDIKRQNQRLRQAMEELRSLQKQLIEKERLAAIGELIITVNHEINNPLTSIMGMAEILSMTLATISPDKLRQGLQVILTEARRIQQVTHQLADLKSSETTDYFAGKKMIALRKNTAPIHVEQK
jgi:signal transduction histidine kinase